MSEDGHGAATDNVTREIRTSARSVGSLVAKQAERAKLSNVSLPAAYRDLGQWVFENGNRGDFPDLHDRIDEIVANIDQLHTEADGVEAADTLGAKAKAVLDSGKVAAKRKVLERTRSQAFIELGKAAFEHDDHHGALASKKISENISRLAVLDLEIEELKRESSEGMKQLCRDPVVIGILLVCVFPVGLFLVWRHPAWSRDRKLGWTGAFVSVLVMGMVLTAVEQPNAQITADFLPYKKGARAVYFIEIMQPGGEEIVTKHVYDYLGGGAIKHTVESMGAMRDGEYVSEIILNRSLSDDNQRKSNGFIATQSGSGEWIAALKLGGKVGDSWESVSDVGQAQIESFGTYTLHYDGKTYQSVVVSEQLQAGPFTTLSKSTYVEHIGLIEKDVYKIEDGSQRLISRWRLQIPDPDWNLTKSERRMFE